MTDDLPTARTHLQAGWLVVLVWRKACFHPAPADLQAIIDRGRGDVPLKDLKFRCTKCGSSLTDSVMMSRDTLAVQPWKSDDPNATSRAAGHLRGSSRGGRGRSGELPPARLNAKSSVPETARLTGGAQPRETSPEAYRGRVTAVAAKDLKQMTLTPGASRSGLSCCCARRSQASLATSYTRDEA
jgi:hypothetical protein